jgi:hypothetical protein
MLLWEKDFVRTGKLVYRKILFDEGVKFDITLSSPADRDISIQLASKADPALIHEKLWHIQDTCSKYVNQNLKVAEVIVFINKMKKSNLYKNNAKKIIVKFILYAGRRF